jgi:hypothetical protein
VRSLMLETYDALHPLLQFRRYWKPELQDLRKFEVSIKEFDRLSKLYVNAFETTWRLLVLAMGLETIIYHRALEIPTKRNSLDLWQFDEMKNGAKPGLLNKYPIADLFVPYLDHTLRNGIGHHSAHYDAKTDHVLYYKFKGSTLVERAVPYSEFCDKVLHIYSRFELSVRYFNFVFLSMGGRVVPL